MPIDMPTPELFRCSPQPHVFTRKRLDDVFESLREFNLKDDIYDIGHSAIGLGMFSDVFRGRSGRYNRLVAVKRIRAFLLEEESYARALEREIRLWVRFNHPNVLPILGFYLDGPNANPNLISEWMVNGTVTSYMRKRPSDAIEMCNMIAGIASGLEYLHVNCHTVHSDLKGSNILVSDDRRPLLCDFGLSISSDSPSLAGTLNNGQNGTWRWMAKELLSPDNGLDHSTMTDVWSLGMVICELLTKDVPYSDIPLGSVRAVILKGELPQSPDFSTFRDCEVYCALWNVALCCWDDVPTQRISVATLLCIVRLILDSYGGASLSTIHSAMEPQPSRSPSRNVQMLSSVINTNAPGAVPFPVPQVLIVNFNYQWETEYRQKISDLHQYPDNKIRKSIRNKRLQISISSVGDKFMNVNAGLSEMFSSLGAGFDPTAPAKLKLLEDEWARRGHKPV